MNATGLGEAGFSASGSGAAPPSARILAIGLMSGTSLDGIDAAMITTDGERVLAHGHALTAPYPEDFRCRLHALLGGEPQPSWQPIIDELTDRHADAVVTLLAEAGIGASEIGVVGFHGQTIWHRPERQQTLQIGDGARLARLLGIPVVNDFRAADVAAGGEGAPLAPLYHAALAEALEKPVAVLNLGGVANITYIGTPVGPSRSDPHVLAFDTGPANALLDDWMQARTGTACDEGGRAAAAGRIDGARVMQWLRHDWFRRPPPKSLDRNAFDFVLGAIAGMSTESGAATLTAFSARALALALPLLPDSPRRWLVCGGGRHNPTLMQMIADIAGAPVEPVEAVGWRGDAIEAEAFAFLAVRSLRGQPLSLPSTTGTPRALTGGRLHHPSPDGTSQRPKG
ncbi:MAG: anhydro-N-acetylmuramic acid kinase [Rhodospirillales bacterium]|nr:anhydro-N-acetylmuramic acid kinase [Rhodospirillales bacterium]